MRSLGAAEIARAVNNREIDAADVVQEYLDACEQSGKLHALLARCPDAALRRARSGVAGPLAGVPMLIKDILDTAGITTTYGSRIFESHVPKRTAAAVRRLENAGAIVIGKANLHEFAWGTTSQNPHFGSVENPTRPGRIAGGSSGGNAAALAANLCVLGLGTDTGGSARGPSACCSTVGLKPQHGLIPTAGCFPLAPSFDTVAPMGRSVADCALAYSVLAQREQPAARLAGLTVGVLEHPPRLSPDQQITPESADRRVRLLLEAGRLEALGAHLAEVTLPEPITDPVALVLAEAAQTHRELYPAQREQYGEDTRIKLDDALSVTEIDAQRARLSIESWRARAATNPAVDIVICPTLGIDVPPTDAREQDVRSGLLAYTRPFNFLDWSAIAIGDLQIAGRDDDTVLGAALAWEEAYGPALPRFDSPEASWQPTR
jgi:aspartyl-tRNA(Asn)/glutamyl-tRNA(Gln) amidotransferase subunit A